jgi:hypothetical protein
MRCAAAGVDRTPADQGLATDDGGGGLDFAAISAIKRSA